MLRALLFLAFALAPLAAHAHAAHHAPAPEPRVAKLSPCPGGGHENCCCHDGWCTTTPPALVVIDAPAHGLPLAGAAARMAFDCASVPRPVALFRFPPRGPPPLS